MWRLPERRAGQRQGGNGVWVHESTEVAWWLLASDWSRVSDRWGGAAAGLEINPPCVHICRLFPSYPLAHFLTGRLLLLPFLVLKILGLILTVTAMERIPRSSVPWEDHPHVPEAPRTVPPWLPGSLGKSNKLQRVAMGWHLPRALATVCALHGFFSWSGENAELTPVAGLCQGNRLGGWVTCVSLFLRVLLLCS